MNSSTVTALTESSRLVKAFEGFSHTPYPCPAGVPTIGWGSTLYPDGRRVTLEDTPITESAAGAILVADLTRCLSAAVRASPGLLSHPMSLGAITDFVYNLGAARYRASTLRKRINEGDWDEAKVQIMRWTRGNGVVLRGLVRRREAERALLPS